MELAHELIHRTLYKTAVPQILHLGRALAGQLSVFRSGFPPPMLRLELRVQRFIWAPWNPVETMVSDGSGKWWMNARSILDHV